MDKVKDSMIVYESVSDDRCDGNNCSREGQHKHNGKEYCQRCLDVVLERELW